MIAGYISATDLHNALTPVVYMAIFDDTRSGVIGTVDGSTQVAQVIALSAAEVESYLVGLWPAGNMPAELPGAVSQLLVGAQLLYAKILAYRRKPELVKTYGAQQGGELDKQFVAKMLRIQASIQQMSPTDNPPQGDPPNVGANVVPGRHRIITDGDGDDDNLGDF